MIKKICDVCGEALIIKGNPIASAKEIKENRTIKFHDINTVHGEFHICSSCYKELDDGIVTIEKLAALKQIKELKAFLRR